MFEYVCARLFNDLLSGGEVSGDWHSSMHDHMSTPISSLFCCQRSAVVAFLLFLRSIFFFTAYRITADIVSCSSSILAEWGIGSSQCYAVQWGKNQQTRMHFVLWNVSSVTGGHLCPVRPLVCREGWLLEYMCSLCFIAWKVVHFVQVTAAQCDASLRGWMCAQQSVCVHTPAHVPRPSIMNLNNTTLPIISRVQGHFGMNRGIWCI